MDRKKFEKMLKNKNSRKKLFQESFFLFSKFYFMDSYPFVSKDFHKEYIKDLKSNQNILFVGFRSCWKTMILKHFIIWCICYKKYRYIEFYCYDKQKAKDRLYDIAIQLQTNKKLHNDFGNLFYEDRNQNLKKSKKKRIGEFVTTNEIKVQGKSVGMSPRGDTFSASDGEYRPDLALFDDIDTLQNTKKTDRIDKNYNWFQSEVIGGLADQNKIVFLGNVVREDGMVPRIKKQYKDNPDWETIWQAIYDDDGNIVRPERFVETREQAREINRKRDEDRQVVSLQELRENQWETAFKQNYLLIPMKQGESIIKRTDIQYWKTDKSGTIYFGIDPAFSEKTASDSMALVITKHRKVDWEKRYYILDAIEYKGREKNEKKFVKSVKNLYQKYKPKMITIENNNGWAIIARMLKRENLSVKKYDAKKDKVTRLMEHQWDIEEGLVKFHPDRCEVLVQQLVNMPNVDHDDLVDAMVYSLKAMSTWFVATI